MKFTARITHPKDWSGPLLALPLFEATTQLPDPIAALNRQMDGAISAVLSNGDFRGKADETLLLYSRGDLPAQRLLLVGLGKQEENRPRALRRAAGTAAQRARSLGLDRYTFLPPHDGSFQEAAQALAEGSLLGLYRFTQYRSKAEEHSDPEQMELLCPDQETQQAADAGLRTGRIIALAANRTRDLINEPPSDLTPVRLAEIAQDVAGQVGCSFHAFGPQKMAELGMQALLGVARGSKEEPRLIIMEHNAGREGLPTIVLVGKGITFDSGGLDIKSHEGMRNMKWDMGGAGVVVGVMQAVAGMDLPVHLVGLIPATENMPGGGAYKPGDVLHSLSGKTIEIGNTDAEGRLVMADALAYAGRYQPDAVIDLATLTGACVVALGTSIAGLMGNDPALVERIRQAAETSGEPVWQLPLWPAYRKQLDSDVADIQNTGGRPAGTITAGLFLQEFVPDCPWAHLDIAGVVWSEEPQPCGPKGASGFGVRLLAQMIQRWVD